MKPPIPGHIILQALRCLRSSGPKSFEQLTANLLSHLIEVPIRVCNAGYQAGVDALAELPIAIEDKRYKSGKQLRERDLEGGIAAASRTYPHLQLWVLVATAVLDPHTREALHKTGENTGIGILVLDVGATEPYLPDVPTISALCATNIDQTLEALGTKEWLDRTRVAKRPPIDKIKIDLQAVRRLFRFQDWVDRLRGQLKELPLWRLVTERQNRRLLKLLNEDAYNSFGTGFNSSKVVSRTAKATINEWFAAAVGSSNPEVAIVLGERFDGKTWCVFDWLRRKLPELSLPVFVIGSNRGISSEKGLEDHILDDIRRVLGASFGRHTEAIVRRQRCLAVGSTPWCLIILNRTTGDWHRDAHADRSRVVRLLQRSARSFCAETYDSGDSPSRASPHAG